MEKLPKDWLTQGLIDFEFKKYLLLAYLKTVKDSFDRVELYPFLGDLVFHYRNLMSIKENKSLLKESFPKELSHEEFKRLELSYREIIDDDSIMNEIQSTIEFSIPKIKESLNEGTIIYDYVESKCEISPIGVTPLYAKEGYLFVTLPPEKETNVYRYQVSIFDGSDEQYQSLNTVHIQTVSKRRVETYESLKLGLIRTYRDLPNPAAFLLLSKIKVPMAETFLPVAKRLFVRHLLNAA